MSDSALFSSGALFSTDYLGEAIRETAAYRAVDVAGLRARLDEIAAAFPQNAKTNESQTEDDFIWPVLAALGWSESLRQQNLTVTGRDDVPDGLLFADADAKAAANAQVRIAEAAVRTATALGQETRLLSPIDGEIARKLVQPGEVVSPVIPAYQVIDIDHPWVALNLREDRYHGLTVGSVLHGHIPALQRDADFKVYLIAPRGDFATWRATREASGYDVRTFEVRLHPLSPIPKLRPGMSVLFDWSR